MATVNAVKRSRPSASASASTTASRAKKSPKSGAGATGADDWTTRNQEDAGEEGWGLFPCVDMKTRALFVEIFYTSKRFSNDNLARQHVADRAAGGDALAIRALRAVFRSKVPAKARSK